VNDPHVVSLHYRLDLEKGVHYRTPPSRTHLTDAFDVIVDGTEVVVSMKTHHVTAESARAAVEPFLHVWEVNAGVSPYRHEFSFVFLRAEVIDQRPDPGAVVLSATAALNVDFELIRNEPFPAPPTEFAISADVEAMWLRYVGYRRGREPLISMAYFCLTVLESSAGSQRDRRAVTATRYRIDISVLRTLGRLCVEGDPRTARKVVSKPQRPLTGAEIQWVEAAVCALVRRAGEHAFNATAPRKVIDCADLPLLS